MPTGRSSVTDEGSIISIISSGHGETLENFNIHRTESSPINLQSLTCHSVSPKLYRNSCTSSTEELSKVVVNVSLNPTLTSAVPCSPIQDVILEEEYEEALLVKNRPKLTNKVEIESVIKDIALQKVTNIVTSASSTKKSSHGIYNEPNDSILSSSKEVTETCRIYQITPTNQLNEIRSRSESDTDSMLVNPDHNVGGRCSTNSSSVGSALTLSESPAVISSSYSPQIMSDIQLSSNNPFLPKSSSTSITSLSVNIQNQNNVQSSSGPPTVYSNSPKGNTMICHHPASPFAPPTPTKCSSSSNSSTVIATVTNSSPSISPGQESKQDEKTRNSSSRFNIVSRRPGRFGKSNQTESSHSSEKLNTKEINSLSDIPTPPKHSERRSEYFNKHSVYEEAWDIKLKRMCLDMADKSLKSNMDKTVENILPVLSTPSGHSKVLPHNRPQSAIGARRRTSSPGSKFSSPPAVPPHRRSSAHVKLTHCNSFEYPKSFCDNFQSTQSIGDKPVTNILKDDSLGKKNSERSHLKHNINPTFDDKGITTDYDYAYNETWSLGVQLNMTMNLSNNFIDVSNTQRKDICVPSTGYMDKIDSADSEESSSLSTSQEVTPQLIECNITKNLSTAVLEELVSTVDNDSLSNDSYEEPWDIRHGRVISELTSTTLIDTACVLSAHDPPPPSKSSSHLSNPNCGPNQSTQASYNSSRIRSVSNHHRINNNSGSNTSSSLINKTIALDDQPWYHETCSRSQAEQLLVGAIEGSFLVRKSETSRNDFSLTIKHNNDYLHMKISHNTKGFILGQYSQPYVSIPHMLHHYSLTMVPVRGAETVILKNPISRLL